MSDTPRTDKAVCLMCHVAGVDVEFARGLERELSELRDNPETVKLRTLLREAIELIRFSRPNWRANQSRGDFNDWSDRANGALGN